MSLMVKDDTMLGHGISEKGIEVDRAKFEVIKKLPPPISIKGVRHFLGHDGFIGGLLRISQKLHILCASCSKRNVSYMLMNLV